MAVLLIVLFVLGQFVFRRALARVVIIKRAVLEIALTLTAEQLQELQQRAEDGKAYVAQARARVAGAVNAQNDSEHGYVLVACYELACVESHVQRLYCQ